MFIFLKYIIIHDSNSYLLFLFTRFKFERTLNYREDSIINLIMIEMIAVFEFITSQPVGPGTVQSLQ